MKFFIIVSALLLSLTSNAQTVFVMNEARLTDLQTKVKQKHKPTLALVDSLTRDANKLLKMKPVSVMDKDRLPVSGNKHDYMSQAPYFWYDSSKPNGLPYMRRDGVRNPEIYTITDRSNLGKLETAVKTLALAWYLTNEEKYAQHAATLLKTWFIDTATKMNPHLDYGQAIPGVNSGRGIGIIETIALIHIADAAGLITGSKSWSGADHQSIKQWYGQYLNWLLTSKNGTDEQAAKNNHGTWYDVQVIDFALFTGNTGTAKEHAEKAKKRIDLQIKADGQMPLETERTNGLGYSNMNLLGFYTLATLAEKAGVDLWNYTNPQGAGVRTALDWIMPYALGKKEWTYQQINPYHQRELYPILRIASWKYNQPTYAEIAKTVQSKGVGWMTILQHGE